MKFADLYSAIITRYQSFQSKILRRSSKDGGVGQELGFDSFWLGEHHFYWYGTCVSPPMVIAALGQRTKKIRLGPAISVLPFHHPLIVAEEYALADNLRRAAQFSPAAFPARIQDLWDVDGGGERKVLGGL
jgi:hypothetical protein